MLLEVCANSLQSALNAEKAGADRIELCSELAIGGVTPSYGLLQSVRERISIPVHILIRPRSGDFTYSTMELDIMKKDIQTCLALGFEGIVTGVLHPDFTVDVERTKRLRALAEGRHFTFHRAFDWVLDPMAALGELETIGVDTLLTSGQQKLATEGMELLKQLKDKATSVQVMPGGGITLDNVQEFKDRGFQAVHLSASVVMQTLKGTPKIPMSSSTYPSDNTLTVSDFDTIQQIRKCIK